MSIALQTKSRPILFQGDMVRAILRGTKTQTRRLVKSAFLEFGGAGGKNSPEWNDPTQWGYQHEDGEWSMLKPSDSNDRQVPCPYGQKGDLLWGREQVSFSVSDMMTDRPYTKIPKDAVLADGTHVTCWYAADNNRPTWAKTPWHPSIHMPRWASRILLKIMDVRVERLCDITEADAYAEGVTVTEDHRSSPDFDFRNDARTAYRHLWERIHGPGSTLINPWVWVIEFKRLGIGHG